MEKANLYMLRQTKSKKATLLMAGLGDPILFEIQSYFSIQDLQINSIQFNRSYMILM